MPAFFKTEIVLGLGVVLLFLLKITLGWEPYFLSKYQRGFVYKIGTGFFILIILLHQWYLTKVRTKKNIKPIDYLQATFWHRWIGIFLPLAVIVHTQKWGVKFQALLNSVFVLSLIIGLTLDQITKIKKPKLTHLWIAAHIVFSTLLMGLIAFHVFFSFSYS